MMLDELRMSKAADGDTEARRAQAVDRFEGVIQPDTLACLSTSERLIERCCQTIPNRR